MSAQILKLQFQKIESLEGLSSSQRELLSEAQSAASRAVAPHSNFRVGAAARLASGEIVSAANVESEVYPAGICAERNLLFRLAVTHQEDAIVELLVTSLSSDEECYPCGLCRQTLLDTERRQQRDIRVIMTGATSATIVESAASLLPFSFTL